MRTGLEELGVRVGDRAVHHDDVAVLGLVAQRIEQCLALDLADVFVVEGRVGVDRAFRQAVVGDDRNAGVLGLLDRAGDGLGVHRVDDEDVHLVGNHRFDLRVLGGRVLLGVGINHFALASREFGDFLLDERLVELLVARRLILGKQQADLDRVTRGGGPGSRVGVLIRTAACSERDGDRGSSDCHGGSTQIRVHDVNLPDEALYLRPR